MFAKSKHKGLGQMLAAFVTLVTALAMAVPAFATSTPGEGAKSSAATQDSKATIVASTGNAGDTLNAYKIVNVTYANNQLSYEFTDTFKTFLRQATNDSYKNIKPEQYTQMKSDDPAFKQMLGDFSAYVKNANPKPTADYTTTGDDGVANFTGVGLGQYVVVGMGNVAGARIYSTVTAEVIPHVDKATNTYQVYDKYAVDLKTTTPGGDKTITSGTTDDNGKATASVGDVVSYQLSADVPTYPAGTTNKTLFMKDTLSDGLTLNPASVKVYAGADADSKAELASDAYTVTVDGQNLYVDFNYDKVVGNAKMFVTYDATVNENAKVGTTDGNPNDYTYTYSNNPFNGETHKHDEIPSGDNGYGEKKDSKTVYTYGLYIYKTASDTKGALANAKFELKLGEKVIATLTTDANGYASYNGLEKGTYTLHEIEAPTGYKLAPDVTVDLSAAKATSSATTTTTSMYTSTKPSDDATQATNADGVPLWVPESGAGLVASTTNPSTTGKKYVPAYLSSTTTTNASSTSDVNTKAGEGAGYYPANIEDNKGGNLPTTGGMGLYLIYGAGIALVVCFIAMEAKKKAANKA